MSERWRERAARGLFFVSAFYKRLKTAEREHGDPAFAWLTALLPVRGLRYAGAMPVLQPKTVQKIGTELAIAWSDGAETYFDLEKLRRACPCAVCGGEPDVMGHVVRPQNQYSAKSFDLAGYDFVGGYGLQPKWGDGHSTGIYSFAYLRRLAAGA